jgi:hypothetical protein
VIGWLAGGCRTGGGLLAHAATRIKAMQQVVAFAKELYYARQGKKSQTEIALNYR